MPRAALVIGLIGLIGGPATAAANTPVAGLVFVDSDGDGRRGGGEAAVPGAVVGAGTRVVVADAAGGYRIDAAPGDVVWARPPDGFVPVPPWAPVPPRPDGAGHARLTWIELGLVPDVDADVDAGHAAGAGAAEPLRFVVASDTHQHGGDEPWCAAELEAALAQIGVAAPRFVVVTGDITQQNLTEEFDAIEAGFAATRLRLVPVPGNHDWYDAGAAWRARLGPDLYSFDAGGAHLIILNSMRPVHELLAFVAADLAVVDRDARVIAFTHGPPEFELAEVLEAVGVDELFAGHWHVNRVLRRTTMTEYDTQPLIMGGLDHLPGGYRVVELDGAGGVAVRHHTIVDKRAARIVGPAPGQCVAPGAPVPVVVAIEDGAPPAGRRMWARQVEPDGDDGRAPVPLRHAGGWAWTAELPALRPAAAPAAPAVSAILVEAGGDGVAPVRAAFTVCALDPSGLVGGRWPQLGGGPVHTGHVGRALRLPLIPVWTRAVGGHVAGGAVIVEAGRVIVAVLDLGDDHGSAIVALDLTTGAPAWRFATGAAVRGAPAAGAGVVVVATFASEVYGLDVATGAVRWRTDLGAGVRPEYASAFGGPVISGDVVVVGNQRRFAALDLATGAIRWEVDPVPDADGLGAMATPAIAGDQVVAILQRERSGVQTWSLATGAPGWTAHDICSVSTSAAPVIGDGDVHVLSGSTDRCTIELASGDAWWWSKLHEEGWDWGYGVAATPALADGVLVVPTQYATVHGIDVAAARTLWRRGPAGPARVHDVHYRAQVAAFPASPVIAGDVAWIAGTDGHLVGIGLRSGEVVAEHDLRAPVLTGLAVAGDHLVVAGYDGVIRVLAPVAHMVPGAARPGDGRLWARLLIGVGLGVGVAVAGLAAVGSVLVVVRRRRRRLPAVH